jgi:ABC-type Na+ efflux pump permease subunit
MVLTIFLAISTWAQLRRETAEPTQRRRLARAHRAAIHELERRAQRRRIFVGFTDRSSSRRAACATTSSAASTRTRRQARSSRAPSRSLASAVLLPLLVTLLAADLVSSERATGTIKMLLTRPVARWRVLAAKLAAMALFASLLVAAGRDPLLAHRRARLGWRGWSAPVLTGFRAGADGVDHLRGAPGALWLDTLAVYGLAWLGTLRDGAVAVTFSVLFKSTAASLGTLAAMLASARSSPRSATTGSSPAGSS